MKKKYSNSWKGSKQPRKQRKYRANAPLHTRHKMASANLSKELRKEYSKRNFPIRKGDSVRIMRGEFRGKAGKVAEVNMKKLKILVEGINRTKKDGTKVGVLFDISNLQIKELNLADKKRKMALERKNEKKDIKFKKLPKQDKGETKENAHK
jgi:large subunit ribosomal protein L24